MEPVIDNSQFEDLEQGTNPREVRAIVVEDETLIAWISWKHYAKQVSTSLLKAQTEKKQSRWLLNTNLI